MVEAKSQQVVIGLVRCYCDFFEGPCGKVPLFSSKMKQKTVRFKSFSLTLVQN
jgi:hypothetical protein